VIAFLTLCYAAIVWLVFVKLKLLPWNRGSQSAVVGVGLFGIFSLIVAMSLFQPFSTDVRVYQRVVQIVPRVTGRVIEIPVAENAPVAKGDVLFRIDPEPFEYEVERLAADLKIKRILLDDANALTRAQVAAETERDRVQAQTNLALAPGQIASKMASLPVMTVIDPSTPIILASFSQGALSFVAVGDAVEIAFDGLPGQTVTARVEAILPATGQGALPPSGVLLEFTDHVAAVYTDRAQAIRIVRKVVIRMNAWLNYVGV
jgi:multidrug resistance efflux pump